MAKLQALQTELTRQAHIFIMINNNYFLVEFILMSCQFFTGHVTFHFVEASQNLEAPISYKHMFKNIGHFQSTSTHTVNFFGSSISMLLER